MSSSYIIRIYRHEENNPSNLVGIVEEVGVDGKKGFTCLDELWGILNCRSRSHDLSNQGTKTDTCINTRRT